MASEIIGQISAFYNDKAPIEIRDSIANSDKKDILDETYPYSKPIKSKEYEETIEDLQVELVKLQSWAQSTGARVAVIFEGRDAAGKGGTIKRFRENLNPRSTKVVALSKPTEHEQGQWYFQRYVKHMPSAGEIVLFDRSWYNRAVVEKVFGFCSDKQRAHFFAQVNEFEDMLVEDGIILIKLWLSVGRAEQLRRFLSRENDRLKQWKLSGIDVKGLSKWDEYTAAISENFERTHTNTAPWTVIKTDDKKRARIAAIQTVLSQIDYDNRDQTVVQKPDTKITGGPEIVNSK